VYDISPFRHHHPPIYNIKQSTVNEYTKLIEVDDRSVTVRTQEHELVSVLLKISRLIGWLWSGPCIMGWLR